MMYIGLMYESGEVRAVHACRVVRACVCVLRGVRACACACVLCGACVRVCVCVCARALVLCGACDPAADGV